MAGMPELTWEIHRLAESGLFDQALRVARLSVPLRSILTGLVWQEVPPEPDEEAEPDEEDTPAERLVEVLENEPLWQELYQACELADRIDHFLAQLEKADAGGLLARACRQDLEALQILADWCEEQGRLAVAAEARHLLGLARSAAADRPGGAIDLAFLFDGIWE
jgi:hypothetical protein